MPGKPTVAIIGASGYVGKFLTAAFLTALKDGQVEQVRVLSRTTVSSASSSTSSDTIDNFVSQGAVPFVVDFTQLETLVKAFTGVDVVVSGLGTGAGSDIAKKAIVKSLGLASVPIYIPSEFGTNHYTRCKNYAHAVFEDKKKHFEEAVQAMSQRQGERSVKVIRILCALIMESSFGKWFGLDNTTEVWTVVGNGAPAVAVTAEADIGRYTVQTALLAFKDPAACPDLIEIYSDMKPLKEYATIFDKVAGRSTKLEFIPIEKALADYNEGGQKFEVLIQILMGEGAFDYTTATGNELLNPGETVWKLKNIEDYAKETGGRPWPDQ